MKLTYDEIKMLELSKNNLQFYNALKTEFLFHSNHIEGSTFSKDNLIQLITNNQVEGEHELNDVYETINSTELFDYIVLNPDDKISIVRLLDWHRRLKKNTTDEQLGFAGKLKMIDNKLWGVDLKLTPHHLVENELDSLINDWYKRENKSINDIAEFHARFELIHPFTDGNGRIGRFIILKQCIDENIDMIAIDDTYLKEYRKALYNAQKNQEYSELENVFEKCQKLLDSKLNELIPQLDYAKTLSE